MGAATEVRKVIAPVRLLVAAAAVLVTIAGTQLFALAEQTDFYFAWTIKPPLTAAFLGASYWASLFLLLDIVLVATWRQARAGLISILAFTTLTLILTLLHLDRFHFGASQTLPVIAAWAWLVVYVVTPVAFALSLWAQLRIPGDDSPPSGPLPSLLRALFLIQAGILIVFGVALLVAPTAAAAWWPGPLTPLTGQAVGAWLVAVAIAGAGVLVDNDRRSAAGPAQSYAFFGILQLLAVARFSGDI
ncbi:MAG TPA: hypothetical protein VFK86_17780, partial [Bauldia sp.]|nr:hypothetical protein [Bauldia sp.]